MDEVLFDGFVDGAEPAVALFDPHAPRELRAGAHPVEAFLLLRALDRGGLALVRWHATRAWRVAVTTAPPPRGVRSLWRRLEDHWIEVGPSGTVVVGTLDRFADPELEDAFDDDEAHEGIGVVALAPGRYRVARFDRRALVHPIDEGVETLYASDADEPAPGPGARADSREVAIVFAVTPLAPGDPPPAPAAGAVRAWRDALTRAELDVRALSERLFAGGRDAAMSAAALAELGGPMAVAAIRSAAVSVDPRIAAAALAAARAYRIVLRGQTRRLTRA